MKTTNEVVAAVAEDLQGFGGHLECGVCGLTQSLESIGYFLMAGWPKHCGYTMTWVTAKQESEAAAGNSQNSPQGGN